MNNLRVSDPLFATPLESVVRRFLSSSLLDSELVTLRIDGNQVQIELPKKRSSAARKIAIQ